jgi:drug/metabolite transporter (DMT)-like permease
MLNLLLLATMTTSFGSNPVVGRALMQVFGPAQLSVFRWVCGAALFALIAWARGPRERWPADAREWGTLLGLGFLGLGICSYASYRGVQETTAMSFSLLFACTMAVVVACEWLAGQARATVLLIGGLLSCLGGAVAIITRGDVSILGTLHVGSGELWALVTVSAWAAYTLIIKRVRLTATPCVVFVATCIAGAVTNIPIAIHETVQQGLPVLQPVHILWLTALVLFGGAAGFIAYNVAVERVGAVVTSAAMTLNPLTTALLAMLLLGEAMGWYHAAGGALVIGGLTLINLDKARQGRGAQC